MPLGRLLVLCLCAACSTAAAQQGKLIFGWVEEVVVSPGEFTLHAKLDTGADTSSLDAQNIRRFERDGQPWVRFTISGERPGERLRLERPLVRDVLIKRHEGPSQRRPVVTVPLCMGPFLVEMEVSLIDRSHFNYPVLIGRAAMENLAVVDPERAYTNDPDCGDFGRKPVPQLIFRSAFDGAADDFRSPPLVSLFDADHLPGPPLRDVPDWAAPAPNGRGSAAKQPHAPHAGQDDFRLE